MQNCCALPNCKYTHRVDRKDRYRIRYTQLTCTNLPVPVRDYKVCTYKGNALNNIPGYELTECSTAVKRYCKQKTILPTLNLSQT
jgi:hypothetical protein